MDYQDQLSAWRRRQDKVVIWWADLKDDEILSGYPSDFGDKRGWPEYLSKAFNSRCGRSFGARVLVTPHMGRFFTNLSETLDYSDFLSSAGVVMLYSDLYQIHGLPGRVTDVELQPVEVPAEPEPRPMRPLSVQAVSPTPPPPPPPKPQYPAAEQVVEEEPPVSEEPEAETPSSKESDNMNYEAPPMTDKSVLAKVKRNPIKAGLAAIGAFILLCLLYSSVYTINETERGLLLTGGKLSEVQEPGLHMRLPILQTVKRLSLQTWTDNFPKLSAYSKDQQPADMRVSVTWTANPSELKSLYRTTLDLDGVTNRFIKPITPTEVENVFGLYTAESLVSDRQAFVLALTNRIKAMVPPFVTVVSIQVEDVNFSDAYELTIEEKAKASVAVDTAGKLEERATIDARAYVTQQQSFATAKKNQMVAEAEGITAKGTAEASAIIAKANALKNNPQLIQLIEAENWNGSRATTIYGAITPVIPVK
jgi:regulator of protease activity HflC (stomatin/prohibitin superfamily)